MSPGPQEPPCCQGREPWFEELAPEQTQLGLGDLRPRSATAETRPEVSHVPYGTSGRRGPGNARVWG